MDTTIKFTLKDKAVIERKVLELEIRAIILVLDEHGRQTNQKITSEDYFFLIVEIRKNYVNYLYRTLGSDVMDELRHLPEFDEYFRQCVSNIERTLISQFPLNEGLTPKGYVMYVSRVIEYFTPNRIILNQLKSPTHAKQITEPA